MSHLRSVDKGTFLRILREGVTSTMRANFTPKITKIQELPGTSPPGPPPGVALRRPPDPMPLKQISTLPPTRILGSASVRGKCKVCASEVEVNIKEVGVHWVYK